MNYEKNQKQKETIEKTLRAFYIQNKEEMGQSNCEKYKII